MPLAKIELRSGKTDEFKNNLIRLVGDSIVESFELNQDDRKIRLQEYSQENFILNKPYEYLIEITIFKGRKKGTKKKLFKRIVETLDEDLKIDKEKILIVINEQPLENWGVRGGISAEEVQFDFEIEK